MKHSIDLIRDRIIKQASVLICHDKLFFFFSISAWKPLG